MLRYHFYNGNNLLNKEEQNLVEFLAKTLRDSEDPYSEINKKVQNKSSWTPMSTHQALNVFKMAFKHDLLHCKIKRPRKYNLSKGELSGLNELRQNPEITIKKADKGSHEHY